MPRPISWRLQRQNRKAGTYWTLTKGKVNPTFLGLGILTEEEAGRCLASMLAIVSEGGEDRLLDMWKEGPTDTTEAGWASDAADEDHGYAGADSLGDRGKGRYVTGRERVIHSLLSGLSDLGLDSSEPDYRRILLSEYHRTVYAPHRKADKPKTWRTEEGHWTRVLASPIASMRLDDVDAYAVDAFLGNMKRAGGEAAGWNLKRQHRQAITALLTYAVRKRHRRAPMPVWFRLTGSNERTLSRPEPLTPDEIKRLVEASAGHGETEHKKYAALLAVAFTQGLRPAEVTAIKWEDVKWTQKHASGVGVLHVPGTKTERSDAHVPLFPLAKQYLTIWWEHENKPTKGLVFVGRGGEPYADHRSWKKPLQSAAKKAGLDNRRIFPYLGRHSAGTNLVEAGVPMNTVAKILRHTNPRMLERHYDHTGALRAPGLGGLFPGEVQPEKVQAKSQVVARAVEAVTSEDAAITEDHWLKLMGM